MSEATGEVRMTKAGLKDFVFGAAKEAVGETIAEQIKEQVERNIREWERKTQTEQRTMYKSAQDAARAHLFGTRKAVGEGLDQVMPTIAGKSAFSGESFAALAFELAQPETGGNPKKALESLRAQGKEIDPGIVKALEASSFGAGGALIPIEYSADFIGYLYDRSVVRALGARTVDMGAGQLTMGRLNGTATAYWVGEGSRITVSQQSFGQLVLNAKKLGIIVPISNDLLRRRPAGVETIIRDDMSAVAVLAEDAALLRGDGVQGRVKGIRNQVAAGNRFNAQASTTRAKTVEDLLKAMYKVDSGNIPMIQTGWAFNPRIMYYLMSLLTDDGYPVFLMELSQGNLYGSPVRTTNAIPKNLNVGGDETEIYFGDYAQVVIGETANMEVAQSNQASFVDAGGNTVHGFQDDHSVMRLIHEVDMVLRHDRSFSVIEGVDWGTALDA